MKDKLVATTIDNQEIVVDGVKILGVDFAEIQDCTAYFDLNMVTRKLTLKRLGSQVIVQQINP